MQDLIWDMIQKIFTVKRTVGIVRRTLMKGRARSRRNNMREKWEIEVELIRIMAWQQSVPENSPQYFKLGGVITWLKWVLDSDYD